MSTVTLRSKNQSTEIIKFYRVEVFSQHKIFVNGSFIYTYNAVHGNTISISDDVRVV
jgi:hypothetical protein